jgi:diguanylate cyclase (GGDEF)-like protein
MSTTGALRDPAMAVQRAGAYARRPARLDLVRQSGLLDAGIQGSLQRYVELAAEVLQARIALVAIIDSDREYYSAAHGVSASEAPLEASYSQYVAVDGVQLSVADAAEDPILSQCLAASKLGIRAYLGSPVSAGGVRVGALCLADTEPRAWSALERRMVEDLAAAASADVELRVQAAEQRRAARTDALTGLGNRRALADAIEDALRDGHELFLGLIDLDGFKAYNESFGHPAGDDLLVRLAQRLRQAIAASGQAFRMGGDEFCVLVDRPEALDQAQQALVEVGPAFCVSSSLGQIQLPAEADDATTAIGIAERRLYGEKRSRPGSVDQQLSAALSAALSERDGELGGHSDQVAQLARRTAERLQMRPDEVRQVTLAARLHDIGKMAISDRILNKTGPLDEDEWALMRCHTMIGERILAAAPALAHAAALVRSSHERWDGHGYPDGLQGDDIPLGARIIFVCDAYDAMRSERPYRQAFTHRRTVDELKRCAGSQFDPGVVDALMAVTVPLAA